MKKILFTFLFSLIAIIGNAQIYNTLNYVDKFDDIIRKETIKTRITIHELDSVDWFGIEDLNVIEIETKGNEPIKYFSIIKTSFGDEENIKEITDGVFGYQTRYFCVNLKTIENNINDIISHIYYETDSIIEEKTNIYVQEDKKESFQKITDEFIQNMEENADSRIYNSVEVLLYKYKVHFWNCILDKEKLNEDEFILVDRTITTQYSGTFIDRLFWIQLSDNSRFIYTNTQ